MPLLAPQGLVAVYNTTFDVLAVVHPYIAEESESLGACLSFVGDSNRLVIGALATHANNNNDKGAVFIADVPYAGETSHCMAALMHL